MKKILAIIVGTRPEAIKLAPLILQLANNPNIKLHIIATGQHRELVQQVFSLFGITADANLNVMQENQSLSELTSRLIATLESEFKKIKLDGIIAQGDTSSVLAAALVSFYMRIPFFHVEAGLRSGDINSPFPEEANRVIAGKFAKLHFAPTLVSKQNLLNEGVSEDAILVTGNTVVDALQHIGQQAHSHGCKLPQDKKIIVVTMHRRENFGKKLQQVCYALLDLIKYFPDIHIVYPVHPNPNVRSVVEKILGNQPQISLIPPMDYQSFVALMKASYLVMTDSGGIQEEAPALGKPVLVLRDETERPEGVAFGAAELVGTDRNTIVSETMRLLIDDKAYTKMCDSFFLYGDGKASEKIIAAILQSLAIKSAMAPIPPPQLVIAARAA